MELQITFSAPGGKRVSVKLLTSFSGILWSSTNFDVFSTEKGVTIKFGE